MLALVNHTGFYQNHRRISGVERYNKRMFTLSVGITVEVMCFKFRNFHETAQGERERYAGF